MTTHSKHLLSEHLEVTKTSRRAFARLAQLSPAYISVLMRGDSNPTVEAAAKIERASNGAVPISSWISPSVNASEGHLACNVDKDTHASRALPQTTGCNSPADEKAGGA